MKTTKLLQILFLAVGMAALGVPSIHAGGEGNPNPGILPPGATYKGKTAGEWTVAWWQWIEGTTGYVQMDDDTGEFAHANNNGADGIFFLASTWAGVPQERHVVIPSGIKLFIPGVGIGAFSSRLPGGLLRWLGSVEGLFDKFPLSDMYGEEIVIDGKPVAGLEDGNHYYLSYYGLDGFETGVFPLATNLDGTVWEFVGYLTALIVNPMPPGDHVIKMKGKSKYELVGP